MMIEDCGDCPSIEERTPDVTEQELAEINASFDDFDAQAAVIPQVDPAELAELEAFLRMFVE